MPLSVIGPRNSAAPPSLMRCRLNISAAACLSIGPQSRFGTIALERSLRSHTTSSTAFCSVKVMIHANVYTQIHRDRCKRAKTGSGLAQNHDEATHLGTSWQLRFESARLLPSIPHLPGPLLEHARDSCHPLFSKQRTEESVRLLPNDEREVRVVTALTSFFRSSPLGRS